MEAAGRVLDAGLHLLDHQLVDSDGKMAGKVDDLELRFSDDVTGPPIVSGIYAGPGALSRRVGGKIGAWIESIHRRLHPASEPGPARVPFGIVKRVDNVIELSVPKRDLELSQFEDWVRDRIISRIPGAHHETD
jgi:sporulation protein YlmC with PRC-barrel domain